MGIDISDENMANLILRYSNRHSNPHDDIVLSAEKIFNWHTKEPINDKNEAQNYMRALLTLITEHKRTKLGIEISLKESIHEVLRLEHNLHKRYKVTGWMKKTLESWLVVFEATGEDSYEATRSSHFNHESDFARKLARRTKSVNTWNYVKCGKEKGFKKYKRSDIPGYVFIREMQSILETERRETHTVIGKKLSAVHARLLHALIGLYFPRNKFDETQQKIWKNYNNEDVITRISEDFKHCSGVDITENMVEKELKKYPNC
jgi:hypothetical protein